MYSKPKILGIEGNTIRIAQPTEAEGNIRTYLTANLAASGTSVTVLDNAGLADDDIIRWGQYGEKTCELKSINGAVTTGTALTSTAVGIEGRVYSMKNTGAGSITIDGATTETIDGELTQTIEQWDNIKIMSNNANWLII